VLGSAIWPRAARAQIVSSDFDYIIVGAGSSGCVLAGGMIGSPRVVGRPLSDQASATSSSRATSRPPSAILNRNDPLKPEFPQPSRAGRRVVVVLQPYKDRP
jgi:hypothetical protein